MKIWIERKNGYGTAVSLCKNIFMYADIENEGKYTIVCNDDEIILDHLSKDKANEYMEEICAAIKQGERYIRIKWGVLW